MERRPRRREGINQARAEELETLLERQFEVAGIRSWRGIPNLSALEIIAHGFDETAWATTNSVLSNIFESQSIDPELKLQIALTSGELFGVGDLSPMESRLSQIEESRQGDSDVAHAGSSAKWVDVRRIEDE